MKAKLIQRNRFELDENSFVEIVVWQVPEPVPPSEHAYKYSLVYIVDGTRVVGFDNERGKGDHKHVGSQEFPYVFESTEKLQADFIKEVEAWNAR